MTGRAADAALQTQLPDIVGGRFVVVRPLAEGAEASVYLARDRELDLDVVLKVRPILDGDALNQLRREASVLMRVGAHPGLQVVRSDLVDGNRYFLISDFVAGHDLQRLVSAQITGRLELPTVLDVIDQISDTLDHLHQHRPAVIHGDVKPENLIVTDTQRVVLVDFGAAVRGDDDNERLGTPGFSAPEVLAGEPLTASSDVYSLSALAVYLLTGVVPTLGTAWPADLASGKLARLEGVLRCGLTWDPLGRPWSASEFARRLRAASTRSLPTGTITLMLIPTEALQSHAPTLTNATVVTDIALPSATSLVVYSSASDAAVDLRRIMAAAASPIAMHAGDVGGWHGATLENLVGEAAPLLATAQGGQVLCTASARTLLGADTALSFESHPLGFVLHDASTPVADTGSLQSMSLSQQRARSWIASRRSVPLAGRESELARAAQAIDTGVEAGRVPFVLAVGESGVGKSRVLAELAMDRAARGDQVFVGRCAASGGAYEPVLDALGDDLFPFDLGQTERDEEGWMDRRRFFGRIADGLRDIGEPITLVFDDLQWLDRPSLALLAQLFDELAGTLVIIAGCRPEIDPGMLDQISMQMQATRIDMGPLTVEGVSAIADASELVLDASTIQDLHVLTGGHPFFCMQLLDHLRNVPGQTLVGDAIPAGVREWIIRRVDRLGGEVQSTLAPAAVIGDSFDVVTLASLLGMSPLEVLPSLDAATSAGLLVDGEHPGQFTFAHALVSNALSGTLSAARRALLHAAVAQSLEQTGDELAHLDAALHHWFEADRLGDPLRATALAVEVATRATERLGHEQAVQVLDRALELLSHAPPSVERNQLEGRARVALGRASLFTSDVDGALRQVYLGADLAEEAGDTHTLAEAALVASLVRRHGLEDADLLGLLERASESCPSEPAVLPAMLHVRRSRLLPDATPHEVRSEIARRGLRDLASMDPVDQASVESEVARACWSPDDALEREQITTRHITDATRQLSAGGSSRWTGVMIEGFSHRAAARVQLGRLTDALGDADRAAETADAAGSIFLLTRVMMAQAMIHAAKGRHEQAEQISHDAIAMSGRHNLLLVQMALNFGIARDRGEQRAVASAEHDMAELIGKNPLLMAGFALVHAESGTMDDARRLLRQLEQQAPWPRDWLWLATTLAALESAVLVHDTAMVRRYAAVLKRYSGQWALSGAESACWGPIDRVLGLAEQRMGRPDQARTYLVAARDAAEREGAAPWVTRCDTALAGL